MLLPLSPYFIKGEYFLSYYKLHGDSSLIPWTFKLWGPFVTLVLIIGGWLCIGQTPNIGSTRQEKSGVNCVLVFAEYYIKH